jgi:hypothetical protein
MATTTAVDTHDGPEVNGAPNGGVQLRHVPLSRVVVLSRGSAASVRMVDPSH